MSLTRFALGLLALGACKAKQEEPLRQVLPRPARPIQVDSVPEGTVAEGDIDAFGLKLPRAMKLKARFEDAIFATGALSLERVSNYVRERVVCDHIETTPKKTVFRHATLEGKKRRVGIEVIADRANSVEIVVRDETPKPAEQGLTEEQRWKQVGLGPGGRTVLPEANE